MEHILSLLMILPADHEYWKNDWMFTRDVMTNASRQGSDVAQFAWRVKTQSSTLQKYIKRVSNEK